MFLTIRPNYCSLTIVVRAIQAGRSTEKIPNKFMPEPQTHLLVNERALRSFQHGRSHMYFGSLPFWPVAFAVVVLELAWP
jgi:hypothetical protein